MAARVDEAALARPLRRRPAGVEPVGRGDGEEPDVAPVLGHEPDRLDRLRRHRARYRRRPPARSARASQPIGAVDDVLREVRGHLALRLLDRAGREAQIDRAAGLVAQPDRSRVGRLAAVAVRCM